MPPLFTNGVIMKDYIEMTVYKCVHCEEFHGADLEAIEEHLAECYVNPANRNCVSCDHLCKYNGIDDNGIPDFLYKCQKNNELLIDFKRDMDCYSQREEKQIPHKNSPEYEEYLGGLVERIQETL